MSSITVACGERFEDSPRGGTRRIITVVATIGGVRFVTDAPNAIEATKLVLSTAKLLRLASGEP